MDSIANKINLLGFSRQKLVEFFQELGEKPFRAQQIIQWVHRRGITEFSQMTDMSKVLREKLAAMADFSLPEVIYDQTSYDGTRKWLLRLEDQNAIETVYIPDGDRGTLCVSSQVGCTLNCSFCATARQGFNRNLTEAEIAAQIFIAYHALLKEQDRQLPLTNVVFMGMGEPLLNFDAVVTVCHLVMDDLAYGLGKRKVTISTAGLVPAILRLQEVVDVSLAISLHAPNNALRDQLVPLNKKYPLEELLEACKTFVKGAPHRRITVEYVMLKDLNDSNQNAIELMDILKDVPSKINLIPFNPFPDAEYQRSTDARVKAFRDILLANGYVTTIRKTRGDDIDAACGQLVGRVQDKSRRQMRFMRSLEVR